jgi:hypothetical protein
MSDFSDVVQAFSSSVDQTIGGNRNPKAYMEALQHLASSSMSESTRFKQLMNDSLTNQVSQYNDASKNMMHYTDMYSNYDDLTTQLTTEDSKLDYMAKELKKKIFASKQKIQSHLYNYNRSLFMGELVMYTTLLLVFLLFMVRIGMTGYVSSLVMYVLMGIGCLMYAGFISYIIVWSTYRKNYDWNKFNWTDPIPAGNGNCPVSTLNKA